MPVSVVDLFCGVGGLSHGFVLEEFNVVAGIDCDSTCKYAYEANNAPAVFLERDVEDLTSEEVNNLFPQGDIKVLVGCAPCQPFSLYTNRAEPDTRWQLLNVFAELVGGVQPLIVSMENVPRLRNHPVFLDFVNTLTRAGYHVTHFLARGPEYGIPQRRVRLVLFASLLGPVGLIEPTHPGGVGASVRSAIGNLEPIGAGETSVRDPLHRARGLSPQNLARIRATTPGGTWKDWPSELMLSCHKKASGQTFRSVYGRMRWDEPGSVITTQCIGIGNGRFGHPEQDRAISLREAALLQTFPQEYAFIEPETKPAMHVLARQIGNAVPVRLGQIVAQSVANHLEEHHVEI
jgi:DNA (cytosine-5)-methyltransferase 1